jgi:hypothetical protein
VGGRPADGELVWQVAPCAAGAQHRPACVEIFAPALRRAGAPAARVVSHDEASDSGPCGVGQIGIVAVPARRIRVT